MSPSAITPPSSTIATEKSSYSMSNTRECPPHMLANLTKPLNNVDFKAYRPLMPANLRAMMNSGSLVLGVGAMIPSLEMARVVATLPHQFCWLDAEHTAGDYMTLVNMIRMVNHVSEGRMAVIVRVPQSAPDLVTHCLNAGASGICFPHIQNVQQAKACADLCRFPPNGKRGYTPFTLFGSEYDTGIPGKNVYDVWDDHICVIAQIEDIDGVKNVEEICAVKGVDAIMVGAHDLSLELGIRPPGKSDSEEPAFLAALDKISEAASKHGPHGMAVLSFSRLGAQMAKRMRRGWRAFKINTDVVEIHQQGFEQFAKVHTFAQSLKQASEAEKVEKIELVVDPAKKAAIVGNREPVVEVVSA